MQVVLYVRHKGESKMVGKSFAVRGVTLIHHQVTHGTQRHEKLDSPGGVDVVVLRWARAMGIREWHHYEPRGGGVLYRAPIATLAVSGVVQKADGRERVYLPFSAWKSGPLDYKVPYITASKVFDLDPVPEEPGAAQLVLL